MKKKKILRQVICLAMATAMMLSFVLSASAYSTVRSGSKGSDVKTLQTMLNKVCNTGLTVDGIFGTNTKKAVVAYQSSKGLDADGICGTKTWSALTADYNALISSASSSSTSSGYATVRLGSQGSDVKTLQKMLNAVRGAGLTVDGIFGTKTKNAVISFQTAQGLTADGICGAKTWAALVTAYNALQSSSSSTSSTTTYNYSAIAKATAETQKIKSGCVLTAYSTLVKAKLYTEGKSYSGISQYTIYGYNGNVVNADWNKINRNIESKAGTSGTLTYEGRSGYSASANRQYIADLLSTRPEGVLVYFYKNDNNQHAVRFCNYDAASGTFYVSDPGSSSYAYTTLQKSSIGNGKYTWGSGYFGYVNKVVYYK